MNVEIVRPRELTGDLLCRWNELQTGDPEFQNPFFRPEYVQAVAAVRDDVEIAVLEQEGKPLGFFAFERNRWNVATPVGGRISDYQGVVAAQELAWDTNQLLRGCRLRACHFDHMLAAQEQWAPYHERVDESPYIELSQGFAAYRQERRERGAKRIGQFLQKLRKLEREVGPVQFVPQVSGELLAQLIAWKSAQYEHHQQANLFRFPRVAAMLGEMLKLQTSAFSGALSALYAGETLAALSFSLRCRGVWHVSFLAHSLDLLKYSPGSLLITRMAMAAEELGITRIDLGKGKGEDKASFTSLAVPVAEGSLSRSLLARTVGGVWRNTRDYVKSSRLYGSVRRPLRWLRETLDWFAYG